MRCYLPWCESCTCSIAKSPYPAWQEIYCTGVTALASNGRMTTTRLLKESPDMSEFIQIHFLTSYPPSNLNRDDLGRPKTAIMGGSQRLRISSQSLKRAWRMSDVFRKTLEGHVGYRTKDLGNEVHRRLVEKRVEGARADEVSKRIAGVFGKLKAGSSDEAPSRQKSRKNDKNRQEGAE